jgi:large repetitive protein
MTKPRNSGLYLGNGRKRRPQNHLISLEPRMMFDGAAVATVVDTLDLQDLSVVVFQADPPVGQRGQIFGRAVGVEALPSPVERAAVNHAVMTRQVEREDFADRFSGQDRSFDRVARDWNMTRKEVDILEAFDAPDVVIGSDTSSSIIFIDTAVTGYQNLVGEWQGKGTVVLIDRASDGIDQVMAALAGRSNIDAIHIVSHGDDGLFWLGTTRIDKTAVEGGLGSSFAAIGSKLTTNGDILIYGCDVGAGEAGTGLVSAIAAKTGADVAASIDDTGSVVRGGDWTLENRLGVIDGATLIAVNWDGLLASAVISINPATTILRVFNAAGTEVSNSSTAVGFAGGTSVGVSAGGYAVWANAGTVGGQQVDLRAVLVTSTTSGVSPDVIRFNQPSASSNDPGFLLQSSGSTGTASIQVRWELVLAGTNTPIAADISYTIADIDGTGANSAAGALLNAPTRESVVVKTDTLSSFQSAAITDIKFNTTVAGEVSAFGTVNELDSPPKPISAAKFNWLNTSNWVITYNLVRAGSTQAGFNHDGNNDFNFGFGGVTVSIPRLDLDANDSTAPGSGATKTYVENGAALSITDTDVLVTNPAGTLTTGTVVLTNAQTGDVLSLGTLPTGITGVINTSVAGKITVNLTGTASAASYQAAFAAILFRNTTERPSTVDRTINSSFFNGTYNSNLAVSTIKVIEVNDAPTAVNDGPLTTAEDVAINNINVLANDRDGEAVSPTTGDPLTVISASALNGTVTINPDGTLNYTPNANYNGTDTITYTISDGRGGTSTATVAITITAVNDAPTPVGTLPSRSNLDAATGISVATASAFADVDGPALTYSASGLPAGLTIDATTGIITGTIDRSASQTNGGLYAVVVRASDGTNATTQAFSWTVSNPAPVAVNDAPLIILEDSPGTTVNVLANDSDPDGDPLTILSASATNGTVVVNADGTLTYTPDTNYNGPATITYTISDGQGGTATATVPVTVTAVNDAPTRVGTLPPQTNVDATAGVNLATATGFADVDGPALAFSATGLPAGLSINAVTGVITGTIDRSASQGGAGGVYAIVVTASDGSLSATQAFSWTVTNPGPTATNNAASTNEDVPIPSINVLGNDNDPDGDPLTVIAAAAPNGVVTINADGTLNYVPNANFNGTDTITYSISDGQGGTATATVTVTIAAVNDAPTPVGALPPQTNLDAATGINVPTAGGFADIDNSTLTYSASGLPTGLSMNTATGIISGTIDRSASQTNGGAYAVTVTAQDAAGLTAIQTFAWTVTNPVPVAVNDTATTAEDTPILISVLPNDSDPDGDPLTVISAFTAIGQATVVGNQVQYTPPANFNGTATITYTISDGQGGTATATITVTVTPVNDAPTATPIPPRNTADGATIAVPVAGSFADVDGDTLTFSGTGLPPGLTIDPATGLISGVIDKTASQTNGGVYTATIIASDGKGGTVNQTITFTVTNPPPVAGNDTASTPEDTPVTIPVLVNDSDPDGDPLTVTSASALNGTVVINPDGTITYTPNPGFNGTDTITYEISDGNGGTSIATVAVLVADVNDLPTSGVIANQTNLDAQVINLPVASAFADPDGDTLTYSATGLPAGLTINAATGAISGTIDSSASQANGGVYSITVTANDGRGGTASSTFSWTITNPGPSAANDTVTTDEDTPVRVPVLANDIDPDGDVLTIVSASAGNGTVTINPDGSLLYTPNANFNGEDTIIYRISDGEGGFATATATITVRPVNDNPTTVGLPNQNGDDGTSVSVSVASAFTDLDGDVLTFSATGLPPALFIDPATGLITGTLSPETSQNGPYVVSITATDPSGKSVTTDFVWSVQNIPPIAVNDVANTAEEAPVTIGVLTNDRDPDGDPLTITSASATNGTVVINPNGTVTFTPNPDFNGTAVVTYTITDGNGGFATATLTVTVGAVNDGPSSVPIPNLANQDNESASVNVGDFFSDKDGDTLSFSAAGLPAGIGIDPATGILTGTLDKSASQPNGGVYSVTITATDPGGLTTSRTFTWTITNPAPTAVNDTATTDEDTPIAIPVIGNDTDPDGDPLTVTTATALNGTVSIGAGGILTYTPNANFNGSDTITYVIRDGNGGTSTATVIITVMPVNDPPVATNDTATTNEDTPVTIGVLGNDSDVDGDPLTVTAATSPNGTVVINPDGTITFTPAPDFNGPTTITYTISDGNGGTSIAAVNITVDAVNDVPVANPSTATTTEDTPVTVPVLANDTDADGDPLTVTAATAPNGTVTINPDGTLTYTPNANFNGTDTITYTVSDGQGGFSTSTVTVTVSADNDLPTATAIAPQNNNDADSVNVPVAGNFSDLDGDALTFTATGLPPGLSISPAGVITGTIDKAASQTNAGVYSVTVTADDGKGGLVSTTFTWTVENPGPAAANDAATTNEEQPVTVAVLANDTDPDGDPLTVTSATAPNGTVVINPDGTITYTPNANFNGTDTITYAISDGNGGTSTAVVTVTVNAVNDAPVADTPISAQTKIDSMAVSIPVAGNFTDLDGDPLTFTATGLPLGLTISAAGVISGTIDKAASQGGPNADGIYTVTVTADDGKGGTVTSTFSFTVTNPLPVAVNDVATTPEDTPVVVPVLTNDSDPDGDPLTVTSATAPNGTVVINPDGTVTYTPNANFNGTDTITYTISDGNGGTSTAIVTVTVTAVNDAPVVDTPLPNLTNPDSDTVSVPVAGNFSDLDGDPLTYTATGLPAGLTINAAGVISGTIDKAASQINGGIYTVTVTADDGKGLPNSLVSTTFSWTVTNPAPAADNEDVTTPEDTLINIPVLVGDVDPDGDTLTITTATAPNGSVTIKPDGTIDYTPNLNFIGTDTITYTISDGNGGTATATVKVTVAAVNDAPVVDTPLPNQTNVDAETVSVSVAESFSDLDGDTLTYTVDPATPLPSGLTLDPNTGIISGTIDKTASQTNGGVYTITIIASDGALTASSSFTWTITNPAPTADDEAVTTAEDAVINIPVLVGDSDLDGDTLTITAASAPNGTVTINPDGTIDYTPNLNFNGTDTITYTISDGNGGTATATVTVTVTPANDAPVTLGLPDLFDIDNIVVSVPVGPAFSDIDGDTLTFSSSGLPAGLSINAATGQIFGQIANSASQGGPGSNGVYAVTITADDGKGLPNSQTSTTFTWTITNTAPLASDDAFTTAEDTPVIMAVLANDTDPDLDQLTIVPGTVSATNGTAVVNTDGTITFTPAKDFIGTATVTYRITDGNGGFSTATAVITIGAVNDAPDGKPIADQQNLDSDPVDQPFASFFADKDGNTLTYSAANLPAGLSIDPNTGVISGTVDPAASQVNGGIYSVEITATDPGGLFATQSFIWRVSNPGPTATDDVAMTNEDAPVIVAVLTNDVDPDGDVRTVTAASAPNGTVVINANGSITYTPDANFNGSDIITYTISDGQGGTSTAIVTVTVGTVNDAPTVAPLPARANLDGAVISVPVASSFADLDGDTLTFTATGLPTGLTIDAAGVISGFIDPTASQTNGGIFTVTVTADDGKGGTASTTFAWTVTNPQPVANDNVATTPEDTLVNINVLTNDSDPDGDSLTVTSASAGNGTVVIRPDGTLDYTPSLNFNGSDFITYTISDGNGGTATAIVTVTVGPVNDAPVATPISPRSNTDSSVISVPVAGNFSDVDGDPLTFTATGLPVGLSISPAGVITGTIDKAASQTNGGVYSVTVTADDGKGGTVSQVFTWTIINPPPVAVNDTASTNEDTPVNINVLATDSDPDGDTLTVTTASAGNGAIVIRPDGTLDYTPNVDFNGTDTVTYTISDGNGGTATATVTVTVGPVNDPPVATNDAATTNEDRPVTVAVLGNDNDLDGDPLTVTTASAPNGTVVINPDGTVTYTPNANFKGTDTITYTISDGKGGTDTATVTVIVAPVNDPPVATNDTASTPEDTPVTLNVLGNDSDVDGDPLTVTSATSPDGQVRINPDGTVTFTPNPNFNGSTTVTYTISDGKGGTSTATVTLTAAAVNDPPVAVNDNASTAEDTPVKIAVLTNDSDADGDPLTITAATAPNGTVVINPDGTITYTPNADYNGVDIITYTISDGKGGTSTATVTIGVGIENDAPVGTVIPNQTNVDAASVLVSVAGNFSDVDGDPLSFSATGLPAGLTINPTTGLISGTIDRAASQPSGGVYSVRVVVADGKGGETSQTFSWTVTNPAPIAANDIATTREDTPVTVPVLANDSDPDRDPLMVTVASAPNGTVLINPDGSLTYSPKANFNGTDTITYAISDGNGGTSTATLTITVTPINDPPVAVNDNASTAEDTPVTVSVLANDSDLDGDPLIVTEAFAANGTVVVNPDGTVTYTPNPNFNGVDTVTYTISDGKGGTSTATITIGVGGDNDPPVSTPIANQANPDSATISLPVAVNFSDVDGDPLIFSATGLPAGLSINPTTGLISGTIDKAASQPGGGFYTVTVTAEDGQGGAVSRSFIWTITNPAPNATNDTATTAEDTPVLVPVLSNDNDPDGDPLTITAASAPNGRVDINPDGSVTYTPNANFNGTDTITYLISDGNGGTATAQATVTVTPVNDPPVAAGDSAITTEDTPLRVPVLSNDRDLDGDPLTVTAATAPNGTVVINPDGTITYTPNPDFNGTDSITYTISDGKGGTSTATVAVTVNPINDLPVAANDSATTLEDQPVTLPVLANDSDPDGDPLTVTAATSPNGSVVINPDGTITFTPALNFNGPATITYTVSDGKGGTTTASVTVTVTPVNDPPVARADVGATPEDTPVRLSPLANDSDVDGNPLTITAASAPNGTVVINPDGTITYTPNRNFNGTDTVTYQISDGKGGFSTATITVTVAAVNDPPVAANDVIGTDEDTPVRIPVLANDLDADGDPLTITVATSPNGTVVINPDGTITFTPSHDFSGPTTITYTISDGKGGTSTATVTVDVRNTNERPIDGDEALIAIGGQSKVVPVLANASDPDGNPLRIFTAKVDVGSIIINPDGTITYTAPLEFQGVATITYIVSDGRGGFDSSVALITVTQANADVNALLGIKTDPGIPDGWLVDALRDQSNEFISTPYPILEAVNDFRSLNGTPDLNNRRPLLTAINGVSWLKGIGEVDVDGHPIDDVSGQIDRIRDLRFGADRLFDHRFGDFILKSLTGFSVRQLNTGVEQVMIESVVRDRVVYVEMRDIGKDSDPRMVEYQLRTRDGKPLPDWIRMDARGLAIIERPVDAEVIRLIVRAIRADGQVFEVPIIVQGATGEIQLDEKLGASKKISAAEPLSTTMALASNGVSDEAARLAAAFNGEG